MNNKFAYWIGIVIVLILIAWGLSTLTPQPEEPAPGDTTSLGMRIEPNAIFAFDQKAGDQLIITNVFFDQEGDGGFVVLHKDNAGVPGDIIGVSSYFEPGEYEKVLITLTTPVANGETIYAMLHQDDGDGIFDGQKDTPIQSTVSSEPIMGSFIIDENAELPEAVMY